MPVDDDFLAFKALRVRAVRGWMLSNHLTDPTVNGFQLDANVLSLSPFLSQMLSAVVCPVCLRRFIKIHRACWYA